MGFLSLCYLYILCASVVNGQLGAIPRPSGPGQASYLSICGKVLAAPCRSGESLPFKGEFFNLNFFECAGSVIVPD